MASSGRRIRCLTDEIREVDGEPVYKNRKRMVEFLTRTLT